MGAVCELARTLHGSTHAADHVRGRQVEDTLRHMGAAAALRRMQQLRVAVPSQERRGLGVSLLVRAALHLS